MILGDVEETVTTVEIDEETFEEIYKVNQSCSFLAVFCISLCTKHIWTFIYVPVCPAHSSLITIQESFPFTLISPLAIFQNIVYMMCPEILKLVFKKKKMIEIWWEIDITNVSEYHICRGWSMLMRMFDIFQTTKRNIPMLFVRGDGVILVSPPMRTGT